LIKKDGLFITCYIVVGFFHFESENKGSFGLQWLFTMEELKFVIENEGDKALALKRPRFCNNLYLTS